MRGRSRIIIKKVETKVDSSNAIQEVIKAKGELKEILNQIELAKIEKQRIDESITSSVIALKNKKEQEERSIEAELKALKQDIQKFNDLKLAKDKELSLAEESALRINSLYLDKLHLLGETEKKLQTTEAAISNLIKILGIKQAEIEDKQNEVAVLDFDIKTKNDYIANLKSNIVDLEAEIRDKQNKRNISIADLEIEQKKVKEREDNIILREIDLANKQTKLNEELTKNHNAIKKIQAQILVLNEKEQFMKNAELARMAEENRLNTLRKNLNIREADLNLRESKLVDKNG